MNKDLHKTFNIPPEPIAIKIKAKEARQRDPDWKSDSMMIWFYGIASYFWKHWGKQLKMMGIDWPGFEKCLSAWRDDFVSWSRDMVKWETIVENIKDHIPRMKKWLDARRGKIKIEGVFPLRM